MHNVCGVPLVPYVPVWITRSALVTHRYTYAPPRCRTSTAVAQDFHSLLSVFSCWTILLPLYSMVWDWCVIRGWPMLFCWLKLLAPLLPSTVFRLSSFSCLLSSLIGCKSLSPSLALLTSFNDNNNNYYLMREEKLRNNKVRWWGKKYLQFSSEKMKRTQWVS